MKQARTEALLLLTNVLASCLLVVVAASECVIAPVGGGDSVIPRIVWHMVGHELGAAASGRLFGVPWYWWTIGCSVFLCTFGVALKMKLSARLVICLGFWLLCGIIAPSLGSFAGPTGVELLRQGQGFQLGGLPLILASCGVMLATVAGFFVLAVLPALAVFALLIRSRKPPARRNSA